MIDLACEPSHPFDVIITHSFSRFFRDSMLFEIYARRLKKAGLDLVSMTQEVGDDPTSQLIRKVVVLFDEYSSQENAKHRSGFTAGRHSSESRCSKGNSACRGTN